MRRPVSDSATLHIPWPLNSGVRVMFTSGSLREQEEPYLLPLELARGAVGQLLAQLFEWKSIGLLVPEQLESLITQAVRNLGAAAVAQGDSAESAGLAQQALAAAVDAANQLAGVYVEQALAVRRRNEGKLSVSFAVDLGTNMPDAYTAKHLLIAFNAAHLPMSWREMEVVEGIYDWSACDKQIEWCRSQELKISAGPLLLLDERVLPDWLALWEGDFENLSQFFSNHIRSLVEHYRGKVDLWICAGRINTCELFSLSEEEKLHLAVRALEIVRECDPDTPLAISFDQPWGEYMSRKQVDMPPLHFADAFVRSDLGLSGLMLELNLGYYPGGTALRDPLEFSQQLDLWLGWGLPLWISVCAPSLCDADPMAFRDISVPPGSWTPATQQAWIARYLPIMFAKSGIEGIVWNQLHDSRPHFFPYGGLFDLHRKPKPALRTLASLRKAFLF
ncbi:MAG: endo-1,4-beta-xylanase [Thermoguttaceae bacterium]